MRILICPNAYKGTLSALQAAESIEKGVKRVLPDADIVRIPMADGGDGTLDAVHYCLDSEFVKKTVKGPLGKPVKSEYLVIKDERTAVIEMARCSGIALLRPTELNPMLTTTYGVGELILDALGRGFTKIIVGIGGSATVDGGIGMAQALGVRFLDSNGKDIAFREKEGYSGGSLEFVKRIDIKGMDKRIRKAGFTVASDVDNPLCGRKGASHVFGPQKGATPEMVRNLDKWLRTYASVIKRDLGRDVMTLPGAGAAGGLGAALVAFLDADITSGTGLIMKLTNLEEEIRKSDLVITGEGRIDYQTCYQKAISGIARTAKKLGVQVIAIGGCLGKGYDKLYDIGVNIIVDASEGRNIPEKRLKKEASEILQLTAGNSLGEFLQSKRYKY